MSVDAESSLPITSLIIIILINYTMDFNISDFQESINALYQ